MKNRRGEEQKNRRIEEQKNRRIEEQKRRRIEEQKNRRIEEQKKRWIAFLTLFHIIIQNFQASLTKPAIFSQRVIYYQKEDYTICQGCIQKLVQGGLSPKKFSPPVYASVVCLYAVTYYTELCITKYAVTYYTKLCITKYAVVYYTKLCITKYAVTYYTKL